MYRHLIVPEKHKRTKTWVQRRKGYKALSKQSVCFKEGLQTVGNISLTNAITMCSSIETNELTKSVEALLIPHS
jgi:hypothetical protein